MSIDLQRDVFQPVLARVSKRGDSLRGMTRFPNSGIESWFKVEIVASLGEKTLVNNKGPDLTVEDGTRVEIKAATDFNKRWCVTDPILKYNTLVLFLAGRASPEKLRRVEDDAFEIVACEGFSDGTNDWLLGLVKPRE